MQRFSVMGHGSVSTATGPRRQLGSAPLSRENLWSFCLVGSEDNGAGHQMKLCRREELRGEVGISAAASLRWPNRQDTLPHPPPTNSAHPPSAQVGFIRNFLSWTWNLESFGLFLKYRWTASRVGTITVVPVLVVPVPGPLGPL